MVIRINDLHETSCRLSTPLHLACDHLGPRQVTNPKARKILNLFLLHAHPVPDVHKNEKDQMNFSERLLIKSDAQEHYQSWLLPFKV